MTPDAKNQTRPSGRLQHGEHLQYLLTAYVFGDLSAAGKAEVEGHLAECGECRDELEALRGTLALAEEAILAERPAYGFDERRRARVLVAARQARHGLLSKMGLAVPRFRTRWAFGALAAMLLVLLVGGLLLSIVGGARERYSPQAASKDKRPGVDAYYEEKHQYPAGETDALKSDVVVTSNLEKVVPDEYRERTRDVHRKAVDSPADVPPPEHPVVTHEETTVGGRNEAKPSESGAQFGLRSDGKDSGRSGHKDSYAYTADQSGLVGADKDMGIHGGAGGPAPKTSSTPPPPPMAVGPLPANGPVPPVAPPAPAQPSTPMPSEPTREVVAGEVAPQPGRSTKDGTFKYSVTKEANKTAERSAGQEGKKKENRAEPALPPETTANRVLPPDYNGQFTLSTNTRTYPKGGGRGPESGEVDRDMVVTRGSVNTGSDYLTTLPEPPSAKAPQRKPVRRWGGTCFPAGTLVQTADGPRAIEEIAPGTNVRSCDPETGEWALKAVIQPLRHQYTGDVISIGVQGAELEATGNHPFWVRSGTDLGDRGGVADVPRVEQHMTERGRWVEARALRLGDRLALCDGSEVTIQRLASRQASLPVFNLTVADWHTYAVSTQGILVHNKESAAVDDVEGLDQDGDRVSDVPLGGVGFTDARSGRQRIQTERGRQNENTNGQVEEDYEGRKMQPQVDPSSVRQGLYVVDAITSPQQQADVNLNVNAGDGLADKLDKLVAEARDAERWEATVKSGEKNVRDHNETAEADEKEKLLRSFSGDVDVQDAGSRKDALDALVKQQNEPDVKLYWANPVTREGEVKPGGDYTSDRVERAQAEKDAQSRGYQQGQVDGQDRLKRLLEQQQQDMAQNQQQGQALREMDKENALKNAEDENAFFRRQEAARVAEVQGLNETLYFKQRIGKLTEQTKELMERGEYRSAEKLAIRIQQLDPLNRDVENLKRQARQQQHATEDLKTLQERYSESSVEWWDSEDAKRIPYGDLLVYPANWKEIARRSGADTKANASSVGLETYDVRDLTNKIEDFPAPQIELQTAGDSKQQPRSGGLSGVDLAKLIRERFLPSDFVDPSTSIEEQGGKLSVMNRPEVQERVKAILETLRGPDPERSERLVRAVRFYQAGNKRLDVDEFLRQPASIPAPVITDEGLDEDAFIEKYGIRPFVDAASDHLSTFGLDVDTASYTRTRALLEQDQLPDPETVRTEEFLNYFKQDYRVSGDETFGVFVEGMPAPFAAPGLELLKIGIKSREPRPDERKPAALTFVVDVSGSMARTDNSGRERVDLIRASLKGLVEALQPDDSVCLITFSDQARLALPRTQARYAARILEAFDRLEPGGATNVEAGLEMGYRMADEAYSPNQINRVIFCSDGVANIGAEGPAPMLKLVQTFADRGIDLNAIGFGMGKYNDKVMQELADRGNGQYHFVNTADEAQKIFREQLPPNLDVLARDAKAQVDFDPAVVKRYRLLGYEKRKIADADFRNDKIDAGEVQHNTLVTALYEIERYPGAHGSMGKIFLRWKDAALPNRPVVERNYPLSEGLVASTCESADANLRFLACVAEFAELLRNSRWAQDGSYAAVLKELNKLPAGFRVKPECEEVRKLVWKAHVLSMRQWLESLKH